MTDASPSVLDDPRWHAFNKTGFQCSCGERHVGLFPIEMHVPKGWPGEPVYEPNEALRTDGNFLSQDFCVMEGKYVAMRMRMPLAIRGAEPAAFMYTVWASLNRPEFDAYTDPAHRAKLPPNARTQARLINNISGYENSSGLLGSAFHQEDGGYPVLLLHGPQPGHDSNHPLMSEQRNGIGVDRMLELFAAYGHDMRASAGRGTAG